MLLIFAVLVCNSFQRFAAVPKVNPSVEPGSKSWLIFVLKSTVSVGASPNVVSEPPIIKLPVMSTLGALTLPWNTIFPTLLKLIADFVASITLP